MSESLDIDKRRSERIERLIETEGLSKRAFAQKVGFSYSNLNKILKGERKVPPVLPTKIVEAYKDIRLDWLLFGEGEMSVGDQHLADAQALQKHMEQLPTRPRIPKNIPSLQIKEYYQGKKRVLCNERPVIAQFSDYDFSLILKNNRMSPKYERGDELFFKKAHFPEWGNDFLLDTDDGLKFKRIYETEAADEDGNIVPHIRCVSYNREDFPDFLINKKLVHGYYRCVGVLRIL